mmetsp:Transcript_14958/g.26893  ORF Transcript_14958/g.26893 Transcript_14958/m.26893 type:complete len:357 (+) Transcript_14958:502-1572(+)
MSPVRRAEGGGNGRARLDSDDDMSPVRRKDAKASDDDMSPVRRKGTKASDDDDDVSPVRARRRGGDSDSDLEPRRGRKGPSKDNKDMSPVRKRRGRRMDSDEDMSPRRAKKDMSPVRRRRRQDSDEDMSPVRRRGSRDKRKASDSDDDDEEPEAMGLLTSKQFTTQNNKKERKKIEELQNMGAAASGANAKTVFRDKRGRKLESLQKFMDQRAGKFANDEEEGMEWGGGLVQKEERERRKREQDRLGSKPFAITRDDVDYNEYLRNKPRWGDTMLASINKKKKKRKRQISEISGTSNLKLRPFYQGEPWSNRYGIRPGYRWDGTDRSNGWERKRMLHMNNMQAHRDQGYKLSAATM